MTHHWQSSGRPLFVKTVYVNGNRHAILSQEDPLVRSGSVVSRKQIRSDSSLSFNSTFSSNSSASRESNSNVGINVFKHRGRQTSYRDISSELQRCLVKLRFPTSCQKNKDPGEDRKKFYSSREETETQPGDRRIRKKCNSSKANVRHHGELDYYDDESIKNNVFPVSARERSDQHELSAVENKKQKFHLAKINPNPSDLMLNCSCEKNWCNIHGFLNLKQQTGNDVGNVRNSFGDGGLQGLILPPDRKSAENKSLDCCYSASNSNPCELYWNNYLTRPFNASLTERVIQWIDLAGRQNKCVGKFQVFKDELTPRGKNAGKTGSQLTGTNKARRGFSARSGRKVESKATLQNDGENAIFKNSARKDAETAEIKMDTNVISFVEKLKIEKAEDSFELTGRPALPDHNSNLPTGTKEVSEEEDEEEKVRNNDDTPMCSIGTKVHPDFSASSDLRESIANQLQGSNQESREIKNFCSPKKTLLDQQEPIEQLNAGDYDGEKNLRIKSTKALKRRINAIKNQRHQSARSSDGFCRQTFKSDREKNSREPATQRTPYQDWINEVLHRNQHAVAAAAAVATDKSNLTRNNLNGNVLLQNRQSANEVACLRESRTAWVPETSLQKPQLHIFLPSLPHRETSEESLSECESSLQEIRR